MYPCNLQMFNFYGEYLIVPLFKIPTLLRTSAFDDSSMTFIHLFKNGHLFFVIALFSRIFLWKVQAPTIRNSRPEVLRRVLSRTSLFSFRSLLSRTRRNLLINKTKVHFSPSLFVFLFTARAFLSRSKLSPRCRCRFLVDVLFVRFDFLPDRHRASSSFAALSRNFNFDPASRARAFYTCRFLPPFPLAPRLTLFLVGGLPFACHAI